MPGTLKKLNRRRVAHKSTGGIPNSIPERVDPVGNPPSAFNTVALPIFGRGKDTDPGTRMRIRQIDCLGLQGPLKDVRNSIVAAGLWTMIDQVSQHPEFVIAVRHCRARIEGSRADLR